MIRLAHVSDIHVTTEKLDWKREDWFNKRLAAWMNLRWFGRGKLFRHADEILGRMMREFTERGVDHVVFSGDATALGFESELRKAVGLLEVHKRPGVATPGNHDYCTRPAARSGQFEKYFAPWLEGERIGAAIYPFAQRVGHVWLISVNSATGNRLFYDAGGAVGEEQLARLRDLLVRIEGGPRILVTHYPIALHSGKKEPRVRGLRDLADVVDVAAQGGVRLWLHGHRHGSYFLDSPLGAPFAAICAGSATQRDLWSYGEYTIEDEKMRAVRRGYNLEKGVFEDREEFTLRLA
jgi:3',5'-cyclic AMP phosphodiesterase CpdA